MVELTPLVAVAVALATEETVDEVLLEDTVVERTPVL